MQSTSAHSDAGAIAGEAPARSPVRDTILRFRKSERLVHWAIAVPFLVCYASAAVLMLVYNPAPQRPFRELVSWTHRISGICLFVLPLLAVVYCRRDWRIHFYNVRQAWIWAFDDVKWLAKMGLAAVSSKVTLPEQGKFNAAEKLNFMMVMTTYPLYIVTGILIWLPGAAFASWVLHVSMAAVATPLILGHIFMATLNPGTRKGLQGMVSGFVDRRWAKHHYRRWYREHFERSEPVPAVSPVAPAVAAPVPALVPATAAAAQRAPARSSATRPVPALTVPTPTTPEVPARAAAERRTPARRPSPEAVPERQGPVPPVPTAPESRNLGTPSPSPGPPAARAAAREDRSTARERRDEPPPQARPTPRLPAHVRCSSCGADCIAGSWTELLRRIFDTLPLFCPRCSAEITAASVVREPQVVAAIRSHLHPSGVPQAGFAARSAPAVSLPAV